MFMCRRRRGLKSNDDLNSAGPPKLLLTLAAWLRVRVGDADNSEEAVVASADAAAQIAMLGCGIAMAASGLCACGCFVSFAFACFCFRVLFNLDALP